MRILVMNIGIILSSVVISAVTAAIVSGALNLYGQWRERAARQRELLFTYAVDLSKMIVNRLPGNMTISELTVIAQVQEMLVEVFRTGRLSESHRKFLTDTHKKLENVIQ